MARYILAALAVLVTLGGYLADGAARGLLWLAAAVLVFIVMVLGAQDGD